MADNLRDRKADRFDGRIETVGIKKDLLSGQVMKKLTVEAVY